MRDASVCGIDLVVIDKSIELGQLDEAEEQEPAVTVNVHQLWMLIQPTMLSVGSLQNDTTWCHYVLPASGESA